MIQFFNLHSSSCSPPPLSLLVCVRFTHIFHIQFCYSCLRTHPFEIHLTYFREWAKLMGCHDKVNENKKMMVASAMGERMRRYIYIPSPIYTLPSVLEYTRYCGGRYSIRKCEPPMRLYTIFNSFQSMTKLYTP